MSYNTNFTLTTDNPAILNLTNPSDSNLEVSRRLARQLIYNGENADKPLHYKAFQEGHGGHLPLELRVKLVSLLRNSSIADKYRYGSYLGDIYIKQTHRHHVVTKEMLNSVFEVESTRG